jgi:hypothetical protein
VRSKTYLSFLALAGVATLSLLRPATAEAQFRRGFGRGGIYLNSGFYYDPFFYDPWFAYGYQYPYPPYPYGYGLGFDNSASIRVMVTPKEAEVYVDGYLAGIVDDFDGIFQRLHVPPGDHEFTFYREGYHTARQKMYVAARGDLKLHFAMTPLGAGEANEPRPVAPAPAPQAQGGDNGQPGRYPPRRMPPQRYAPPPPPPPDRTPPGPPPQEETTNPSSGTLTIRVQPANAEILIDGERWRGPNDNERLVVQVSEGTHRIEVKKDGFQTFSGEYEVHRGTSTPVNISLSSR